MAKGNKGMPRGGAGAGGGSIEFSSAAVARSGDWSDSMSDDSESEMLMLEKSSSGGSGSDSGSALPLDSIDAGALTLDALDRTKALAAKPAPGIASMLPAADRQSRPAEPSAAAGGSKAPASGGTLGRVLAATQAYTKDDGGIDRKTFLAGLGDEEESEGLPQSAAKPPVPARRTGVKGKPAAYGAAAASAAVARPDPGKKIALSLPSDEAGGVTPGKKPRVVTGTGSTGNEGVSRVGDERHAFAGIAQRSESAMQWARMCVAWGFLAFLTCRGSRYANHDDAACPCVTNERACMLFGSQKDSRAAHDAIFVTNRPQRKVPNVIGAPSSAPRKCSGTVSESIPCRSYHAHARAVPCARFSWRASPRGNPYYSSNL